MTSPDLSCHHDVKLDRWFRFFRHFVNDIILHISSPSSIGFFPVSVRVLLPGYTSPALRSTPICIRAQSYSIPPYFLDKLSLSRAPSILPVISSIYDRLIDYIIPGTWYVW